MVAIEDGERLGPSANRFICPECRSDLVVLRPVREELRGAEDLLAECRSCRTWWTAAEWRALWPAPISY